MKNYTRIYSLIMILMASFLIIFEITAVSFNFKISIDREIETLQKANYEFSETLENSIEMLEDYKDDEQSILKYVSDNLYRSMENHTVIYQVHDKTALIYSSRLQSLSSIISSYPTDDRLHLSYLDDEDQKYIQCIGSVILYGKSFYVRTTLNVTEVYQQRDLLIKRYRVLIVFVLILLATGLYLLVKSFEKNVRFSEKIKQVELTSKRQEEFSASFAHECRTPLTSIIGYSDLLLTTSLNMDEQKESIAYIKSEGMRLERLTHQMMVLTNLRDDVLVKESVDVQGLLDKLRTLIEPTMVSKGVEIKLNFEDGFLYGVEDLYLTLLLNLIENARKAVSSGGHILVSGVNKRVHYKLMITDDGCGMDGITLEKMMEPFYMADQSRTRNEGGAGLGMSLVRRICSRLNIKLEVVSTLNKGTTFTLLLPLTMNTQKEIEGVTK